MAKVTPSEYVEKWSRRMKSSTEDVRRGVEKVTEAPGIAAAAAADRMLSNLTDAIVSGRWGNAVSSVTLAEWRQKMLDKGVGRIAAGVDAASPSQQQMAQRLLSAIDEVSERVRAMPKNNIEDSIARMTEQARQMHARRGTFS